MAGNKIHVFDFLDADLATRPVCVLFGDEPFLRGLALAKLRRQLAGDGELFESSFPADVAWRDVHDEVSTLSLFGGDNPRFVVVDEADAFVTEHRARLEDYVKQNKHHGVLVLLMEKFAGNTRLFKAVNAAGLP
ncbi:MAG: hypothetical protein QGG36_00770, partial [Pirellulaceae bacterium]|nr:hypothetical protein [Pirellulaceae bacterium]